MKLPRDMDAAELIKALGRLGYRAVRQSGSHVRLQCDDPVHAITIPNHRPLRVGTLAAILADVAATHGVERDALIGLLFG
ncbi:type II toxin-antitoxin system HicA family toxin [Frateuria defendens]|uniref:type II toxin-antitoxin system HicA family toxin n=1 Tax=Frateuria defendens TaxID=2219559 RepID=UPI00066FBC71|nr:type II toxin-antitoxin system HicA family toxin [Frateuria defendens]